eukprot:scaffold7681_cov154-Skeletonema_menzelii.AAC.14
MDVQTYGLRYSHIAFLMRPDLGGPPSTHLVTSSSVVPSIRRLTAASYPIQSAPIVEKEISSAQWMFKRMGYATVT